MVSGSGRGSRPKRRITAPIFCRSGGPLRAAAGGAAISRKYAGPSVARRAADQHARRRRAAIREVVNRAARREHVTAGVDLVDLIADDVGHHAFEAVDDLVHVDVVMCRRHLRARRDADLVEIEVAAGLRAIGEKT